MTPSYDAQPPRDPRLQQVLDRAAADPHFRRRLLAEPHAAIRDTFGIQIPSSFRLKFVERGDDADALIVLPNASVRAAQADGELDDASLEAVAGGWGGQGSATQWSGGEGSASQSDWNGWSSWGS